MSTVSELMAQNISNAQTQVQLRTLLYNVKDYGAKGDGVTDDKAAIQKALDACEKVGGGIVFLPNGTYAISAGILVPSNVILRGVGWKSIIKASAVFTGIRILIGNKTTSTTDSGIVIEDLCVDANNMGSATNDTRHHGIVMTRVDGFVVSRCKVINCTGYGIWAMDDYPGGTTYSKNGTIRDNYFENNQVNIETTNSRYISITDNHIKMTDGRSLSGIHPFDGSTHITITGNTIEGASGGCGIDIVNVTDITLGPNNVNLQNGTINPTDASEAIIIQGGSFRINITGGNYKSLNATAINIQNAGEITITGAYIDGWVTPIYADNRDNITIVGNEVRGRGPSSGGSNAFGIYLPNCTGLVITNNRILVEGQDGFEIPLGVPKSTGGNIIANNYVSPAQEDPYFTIRQHKIGQASITADGANGYAEVTFRDNVADWDKVHAVAMIRTNAATYTDAKSIAWDDVGLKALRFLVLGKTSGTISYEITELN